MRLFPALGVVMSLFLTESLSALPSFPKAREETEPKIPSPYERCQQPLKNVSEDLLFTCAEHEFWHAFSDGRLKPRKEAETILADIMKLTQKSTEGAKRGRLLALRGYLRLSMALENAKLEYLLLGGMENDFKAAKKLDTENKTYDTFLDTIIMAKSAAFGDWKKATALALPAFEILKDHPTNILALSGTTIGFPMNSGLPQKTIEFLSTWTCPDDIADFCYDNTQHAPFARPGLSFHFAEAYARMGDRAKTIEYLEKAKQAPAYDAWQYKHLVEKPLADMDTYMAYWNAFGPADSAFDKVYANQNFGCVMCHGR
ncbi:MAG TPA: hypothetical protein VE954_11140 [Oligoflexus sp.]|uniref:hypothetical protein n=1 Tax=Oligoflexus sp. TaxID=1971216 RepID=UPI002D42DB2C|nr:hypothetical protein [Oligoflexus sp.]HYX33660.1 hypothetical protein [Oligoflexus sp.]